MKKSLKKSLDKVIKNHAETFKKLAKKDTSDTYVVFETKVYEGELYEGEDTLLIVGEIFSEELNSFIGKQVRVIVEVIDE